MSAIEELYGVLGWKLEGEADLKRFKSGVQGLEKQLDAFAKRAATFAISIGTIMAGATAALGKSVISTSAQFEGFEAALTTIEGSADKASKSMDWVAKFARETPYDVAGVTDAFIKLKTYGIDPIADDALRTLGDAASAMNKPLNQAVEALADATTFQFERLREFGITTQQKGNQVTFSFQKDGKQVQETVKKTGEAVRKWLLENLGGRFNGAMLRQSKTWDGMVSNLGDSWVDFQRRIGRGGFFDTVKGHLGDLLDYIGKLDEDGTLDRWSKSLSTGLTSAVEFGKGQIQGLIKDFEFLKSWFGDNPDWIGPLKAGLMTLAAIVFPKTAALVVLQDVFRFIQGRESTIGDLAKELEALTGIDAGPLGTGLATIAFAGAGLMFAVGPTKALSAAIRGLAAALGLLGGAEAAAGAGIFAKLSAFAASAGGFLARGLNLGALASLITFKALDDVPHEAMASATKDNPDLMPNLMGERNRWQGVQFEGGRHRVGLGAGPAEGNPIRNFLDHSNYLQGGGAGQAVVNDNSDRSIHVKATATVSVTEINQAAAAAGRETENAVRNALTSKPRLLNKGME